MTTHDTSLPQSAPSAGRPPAASRPGAVGAASGGIGRAVAAHAGGGALGAGPRPGLLAGLLCATLLAGCGAAPPSRLADDRDPDRPADQPLLADAEAGHFLPPARRFVHPALRTRLRRHRPAGPGRQARAPRSRRNLRSRALWRASQVGGADRRGSPRPTRRAQATAGDAATAPKRRASAGHARLDAGQGDALPAGAQQRLEVARGLLGSAGLDKRAFVDHVLHAAGDTVRVSPKQAYAAGLWRALKRRRVSRRALRPGDVVFFRHTLDLNRNGRADDGVTWSALVTVVEPDRVLFIGQRAGRVRRMSLSLAARRVVRDRAGRVRNTRLVRWPDDSRARTAGECVVGFARP